MNIEKAQIRDAKSIVEINIKEWKNTYKGIFPDKFLKNLKEKEEESIEKCKSKINEYIVCKINNQVVGFLRFGKNKKGYNDNYAEIYALYISKDYQRKGIGVSLINFVFEILKFNYKYVLISTLVQNEVNLFYKKIGGKLIDKVIFSLENNEYEENLYEYEL
ncbi:gCN5-related N-acetyltransferase [Mycoplasma sp. CAG:776]|nr:gCN5-related N-acetyltransferase [Mycoplasma sp. CAG:776]